MRTIRDCVDPTIELNSTAQTERLSFEDFFKNKLNSNSAEKVLTIKQSNSTEFENLKPVNKYTNMSCWICYKSGHPAYNCKNRVKLKVHGSKMGRCIFCNVKSF